MADRLAIYRATELVPRVSQSGDGLTIEGYLTVFGETIRVWDPWTGDYYERIDRGAVTKTIAERTPVMLWNHGHDVTGKVPVGVWQHLEADKRGLFGRGRLFDNSLVQPVRDAIEGGAVVGQSITFRPIVDQRTEDYQDGLPLIVRKEIRIDEGGPVTMAAYESTTVGVRSLYPSLTPAQRAEIERILSATSPGVDAHEAGQPLETPEPVEATTSRSTPDPYLASLWRRHLLKEF